jgi:hypothetical protein
MGQGKSGIIFVLVIAMAFNVSVATGEVLCISDGRVAIELEHSSIPVESERVHVCPCSAHLPDVPVSNPDSDDDCGNCQDIPLMTGSVWATAELDIPMVDVDLSHAIPLLPMDVSVVSHDVPAHLTFDRRSAFSERSVPLRC